MMQWQTMLMQDGAGQKGRTGHDNHWAWQMGAGAVHRQCKEGSSTQSRKLTFVVYRKCAGPQKGKHVAELQAVNK